jgi:chromosomal replication initiator protein
VASTLRQHDRHSFLVLPENRLAVAAIKRLAPLTRRRTLQMVSLFGSPGTGKSRLARELIRSWEGKRSDGKIIYVTASEYAAQLAQASTDAAIRQFQSRYRKDVSLFVCEDLQSLAGRKESQQQLETAIDDVVMNGGCVLLTSTLMPSGIRNFSARLANRIRGGLCVDVPLPAANSRRKLIDHFLETESIQISTEDIATIAREYEVSPRELQGVLHQLQSIQKSNSRKTRNTSEILKELTHSRQYTLQQIASATSKIFGVRVSELRSGTRSKTVSTARQAAMFLTRELTDLKYKEIGEYFGRGNHSTVIHACKKISTLKDDDAILSHHLEAIKKRLQNRA